MKKWISFVIALAMVLGMSGMALAAGMKASGKVVAVDEAASTITVHDKGGKDVVISVSADDAKKAKKGNKATVDYHEAGGKNVADKVTLKAAKAAEGC
jgi:ABC-type glycerol-3-phosphate transport system substrate-binding protein